MRRTFLLAFALQLCFLLLLFVLRDCENNDHWLFADLKNQAKHEKLADLEKSGGA
jgi:hypothetical protein